MEQPFQWDYPTQGLVFHRSIDQAFRTGAAIEVQAPRKVSTPDAIAYTVAALILLATIIIATN